MIKHFPSRQTKKWMTSFKGKFFGDIVRSFNIDLFSLPGIIKIGKKLFPHTTDLKPPSDFTNASLYDGTGQTNKTWAISEDGIYRSEDNEEFELDNGDGFGIDEITNGDILPIKDEADEDYEVVPFGIQNTVAGFPITGMADSEKWAQSFTNVGGPLSQVSIWIKKLGSPTDNLTVSIQEDDGGKPDGVDLATISIAGATLTTDFAQKDLKIGDFTPTSLQLDVDTKYWLVFERDGSASQFNYYKVSLKQDTTDPYEKGELLNYNGTTWTRTEIYKKVETFFANGNWTVPTGVLEATIELWGAGGGGKTNTGAGGGGAYARSTIVTNPTDVKAIVIGAGAADTNGGGTTFDTNVVVAAGGKSRTNGGAGGATADCTGDVKYAGGEGSNGTGNRSGGGSAGDIKAGTSGAETSPGAPGQSNGGLGGSFGIGRVPGGGGGSSGAAQNAGGSGLAKVTYDVAITSGYPYVLERSWSSSNFPSTTDNNIFLPKEILPGELLICVISIQGNVTASISGWTSLGKQSSLVSSDVSQNILYKIADGSEVYASSSSYKYMRAALSSAKNWSAIVYRIAGAGIPTATLVGGFSGDVNPPKHTTPLEQKYLWIAAATLRVTEKTDITVAPANYTNFIIQPEAGIGNSAGSPALDELGARTAVAERLLEASSEDPGTFTNTSIAWVAGTIAVPPIDPDIIYYQDASIALQVTFPKAEERLYITTDIDVKFLNEEDGTWQSLWKGIYQQDDLNKDYPHPMKNLGAGGTLIVGDGNKVHIMAAKGEVSSDLQANKLILPSTHFNNWIIVTKSAVFLGFQNKDSEELPSMIVYYEPYSEYTRIFEIKEGATVGYFDNDNCKILDKTGQLRYFTGSGFDTYDYFPTHFEEKIKVLPHRNGIVCKNNITTFLWEGQGEYPGGLWEYNDGRLYHKSSMVFDQTTFNSYGAMETEGGLGALYLVDKVYIGGTVADDTLTKVEGIFTDTKNVDITVATDTVGHIETSKVTSNGVDNTWQRIYSKPGERNLRYRMTDVLNSSVYEGTWTSATTFTATGNFATDIDNSIIKVGDEVIIKKGASAGLTTFITQITGTTTKTVTVKEGLATSGKFKFNTAKWIEQKNEAVAGDTSEWIQLKATLEDNIEELQIGFVENRNIEE